VCFEGSELQYLLTLQHFSFSNNKVLGYDFLKLRRGLMAEVVFRPVWAPSESHSLVTMHLLDAKIGGKAWRHLTFFRTLSPKKTRKLTTQT
jgi:hypothetical protein